MYRIAHTEFKFDFDNKLYFFIQFRKELRSHDFLCSLIYKDKCTGRCEVEVVTPKPDAEGYNIFLDNFERTLYLMCSTRDNLEYRDMIRTGKINTFEKNVSQTLVSGIERRTSDSEIQYFINWKIFNEELKKYKPRITLFSSKEYRLQKNCSSSKLMLKIDGGMSSPVIFAYNRMTIPFCESMPFWWGKMPDEAVYQYYSSLKTQEAELTKELERVTSEINKIPSSRKLIFELGDFYKYDG